MSAPSEFTVVQFLPDPLADERINVGVIVIANGVVRYNFVSNHARTRAFAKGTSIEPVLEFRERLMSLVASGISEFQSELPVVGAAEPSAAEFVRTVAGSWNHQIQCTPIQPSMDVPERLLARLSNRYLQRSQPKSEQRETLTKTMVASRATHALKSALPSQSLDQLHIGMYQRAKGYLIPTIVMDLSVYNGRLKLAGMAASFQVSEIRDLKSTWREAIWSLDDLRKSQVDLLVSFHVAQPLPGQRGMLAEFEEATETAQRAGIPIVVAGQADVWARSIADNPILKFGA